MMGKAFEEAEHAEFVDGDHARAAELYRAAIPSIPNTKDTRSFQSVSFLHLHQSWS